MKPITTIIQQTVGKFGYRISWVLNPQAKPVDVLSLLVTKYFKDKSPVLVQIGANDGITFDPINSSVTKEWSGVLVEPDPTAFKKLQQTYQAYPRLHLDNVAISQTRGTIKLHLGENSLWSSTNQKLAEMNAATSQIFEVQAEPLKTFLARHNIANIDIFIVDAEGDDFQIMEQLFEMKLRPRIIQFEHILMGRIKCNMLWHRLVENGYALALTNIDTIAELQ
jgi:FkbM family methyltransferase